MWKKKIQPWIIHPVTPWIFVFVIVNFLQIENGGTNASSRLAAMRAITEQQTFQIDRYVDWTIDWSQGPDGHYYSNKAPGPILLGLPVFWVGEWIAKPLEQGYRDPKGRRKSPHTLHGFFVSFFTQIVPMCILAYVWGSFALARGISLVAIHFGTIALLLGTTTSIFFNSYFGHAFAAVQVVAMTFFLVRKKFFWVGFFYGTALLSAYSNALLLFPVIFAIYFLAEKRAPAFRDWVIGGILPGLLWIFYHQVCFGSPFAIALQYQNPLFVDSADQVNNIWGVLAVPDMQIFMRLLFGPERGLLFTQPWLVLCLGAFVFFWKAKIAKSVGLLAVTGLFLLLLMNASFGGWHGGGTVGPRYLSAVLPLFAICTMFGFDRLPRLYQVFLWGGLCITIVFRGLVAVTSIYAEAVPLWPHVTTSFFSGPDKAITYLVMLIYLLSFIFAGVFILMQTQYRGYHAVQQEKI